MIHLIIIIQKLTCNLQLKQESIPVRCVPPACVDCKCFSSHLMSATVGDPIVNKSEQVSSLGHQISLERVGLGGSLYSEVPCPGGRGLGGVCTVRSNVQGERAEARGVPVW